MKAGIEAGVALVAAGLLTTGQKVAADEQAPTADTVTETSHATTAATTKAPADQGVQTGDGSQTGDPDVARIKQQLQDVVSTQLQADASAQAAAKLQAENNAQQAQYDQHDSQIHAQVDAYTHAVDQYTEAKQNFEVAQAHTQIQMQAYNERSNQYQLQADAYNAQQSQAHDQHALASQITDYNAQNAQYSRALQTVKNGITQYQTGLTQYQQVVAKYDSAKATPAQYVQLQTAYQQLVTAQGQIQASILPLQTSQKQLATTYATLQAAVKKVRDAAPADSGTTYSALNAQRQALLTEAARLTALQAHGDQNAALAQSLMATYQGLVDQRVQLQQANAQLEDEYSKLSDNFTRWQSAQTRADADQDAADKAKATAKGNISTQIHEWIDSLRSDGGSDTSATTAHMPVGSTHAYTSMAARQAFSLPTASPVQVMTSPLLLPLTLTTPALAVDTITKIAPPADFTVDKLLTTAILLPEAPTTSLVTTTAVPVTRVIKVLDETTGAMVMAMTLNQDDVQFTLPEGYHLAATQAIDAQANGDQAQVTLRQGTSAYAVYVAKDVPAKTTTPAHEDSSGAVDAHNGYVAPEITQKTAPVVSVDQSSDHDTQPSVIGEETKGAPAVSVHETTSGVQQSITPTSTAQSAPAVSVSQADNYDLRQPETAAITKPAPAVSANAKDDEHEQTLFSGEPTQTTPVHQQNAATRLIVTQRVAEKQKTTGMAYGAAHKTSSNRRSAAAIRVNQHQRAQVALVFSKISQASTQRTYPQTGDHQANWLSLLGVATLSAMTTVLLKRRQN